MKNEQGPVIDCPGWHPEELCRTWHGSCRQLKKQLLHQESPAIKLMYLYNSLCETAGYLVYLCWPLIIQALQRNFGIAEVAIMQAQYSSW